MPRAKRPLAEVDPNASTRPSKRRAAETSAPGGKELNKDPMETSKPSRGVWRTRSTRYSAITVGVEAESAPRPAKGEQIEYTTKDNSKLRRLLLERDLSTSGTREELIERLKNSSIDYDSLSSGTITEMLKCRHIKMAATGSKEFKIQRLRVNDKIERDTGNSKESVLYGTAVVAGWFYKRIMQRKATGGEYASMDSAKLRTLLQKKKLSLSGSQKAWVARLQADEQKNYEKELQKYHAEFAPAIEELAERTGRSIDAEEVMKKEEKYDREDMEIQMSARPTRPPIPACNYDGSNSHWASRTERELREICERREMPGHGPRAAMLKWLDTGSVDYEDLYAHSLETLCSKRGISYKSQTTKVELIRLLTEADEHE